jgi:hypothetical protein
MAERTTAKAKRREPPKGVTSRDSKKAAGQPDPAPSAGSADGGKASAASSADNGLAAENSRLKSELAEARERIADLELRQTEISNRIAWVIDSLHTLKD